MGGRDGKRSKEESNVGAFFVVVDFTEIKQSFLDITIGTDVIAL